MQGLKRPQNPLNSVTSCYRQKLKLVDTGSFKGVRPTYLIAVGATDGGEVWDWMESGDPGVGCNSCHFLALGLLPPWVSVFSSV